MALLGRREGGGKFGDGAQGLVVGGGARWAWAKKTASQKPPPSASITASQSLSVSASLMSPASTAHSMPLE